ncbi:hypothetical protein F8388_000472 [Cannabis sativa]|uniref:Uncharacterized protein n=1 Tax=Cannabis sativa TaxID=3483 RepID=A0A7J6EZD2_CANSA|nr:hypothetical protein F8388_000472 [Cannabis sativa]KAF4394073.1 hypothetical protein G4B88_026042 [Cannabis sativa]
METLLSHSPINLSTPNFPTSNFLFNFPSLSRESRSLSHRKWPHRPRFLRFSIVAANSVSGSASYGGWDNLGGLDCSSGETTDSDQFRKFLVSVGIYDRKHVFVFALGLLCALVISRVRVSSIIVFPASVLVFAVGFSLGVVRGGGIGELMSYNENNNRKVKDETFRVYIDKVRILMEIVDEFDVKVNNLKKKLEKAIDCREIRISDLEDYTRVLDSISLSSSNVRNVIESSNDVLVENQKSNKKSKELGEIGNEFFQSLRVLFRQKLVDSKPSKVKGNGNVKRGGTVEAAVDHDDDDDDDETRVDSLVSSDKEKVLHSVDDDKSRGNFARSHGSLNEIGFDENGDEGNRNRKMSFNYSNEYNKRVQLVNNRRISLKMDHDHNKTETWERESDDNLLESVSFSVRMQQRTKTEASFARKQKLERSDDVYSSSRSKDKSEYNTDVSPLREESMNVNESGEENEIPSSTSSMVSDDVLFDRYLSEANDLLRQAKEFMRDSHEKELADIVLYKSANILSKAIAMKPMSLLAVGLLGNTYLLHGELKLRISRELRTLLSRSNPSSVGKWGRIRDQTESKDEIAYALVDVCEECEKLLVEAGRKYRLALSIDGNDVRALYNWGLALTFRAQLIADIGPEASFDADKVFLAAIDKFDAMMSKGNDFAPDALFKWGMVLQQRSRLRPSSSKEKMKLLQQAKRLYEDALDMNSNNLQVRQALSTCISELSSRQF